MLHPTPSADQQLPLLPEAVLRRHFVYEPSDSRFVPLPACSRHSGANNASCRSATTPRLRAAAGSSAAASAMTPRQPVPTFSPRTSPGWLPVN
jgi:hypothetical protein